jgi:hypothetical protein
MMLTRLLQPQIDKVDAVTRGNCIDLVYSHVSRDLGAREQIMKWCCD